MKSKQQDGTHSVEPCDICGDVGWPELIATCSKCNVAREHIYCMPIFVCGIPDDWICRTCHNENDTISTARKYRKGGTGEPATLTDPLLGAEEHAMSSGSQVGDASSSDTPVWGSVDPATRLTWIRPIGTTEFEPCKVVVKFMDKQLFRNYNHPWGNWSEIPPLVRDAWFNDFLNKFRWLPAHQRDLRKAFNYKASKWLSDRFHKLRENKGKSNWIHPETAAQLLEKWATDEKWQKKSLQNKLNRSRMDGPSYTGGSIPISQHRRNVKASRDVPPGLVDWVTFERTHSQESAAGGKHWINGKSLKLAENWEKLSQERATQTTTDHTSGSSQSDNKNLFIQAAGGFDKKGRVFGLGASASRLKASKRLSSQVGGVSAGYLKRMKALDQRLDATTQLVNQQVKMMKQLQEQLQALLKDKKENKDKGSVLGDDDKDDQAASI